MRLLCIRLEPETPGEVSQRLHRVLLIERLQVGSYRFGSDSSGPAALRQGASGLPALRRVPGRGKAEERIGAGFVHLVGFANVGKSPYGEVRSHPRIPCAWRSRVSGSSRSHSRRLPPRAATDLSGALDVRGSWPFLVRDRERSDPSRQDDRPTEARGEENRPGQRHC